MISGLDDVVVAETMLSDVDGQSGRLIIRGQSLDELIKHATFEGVVTLLWEGFFKESPPANDMPLLLAAARRDVFEHLAAADADLMQQPTVDAVRALVARLPDAEDIHTALLLVAAQAVFAPGVIRLQRTHSAGYRTHWTAGNG